MGSFSWKKLDDGSKTSVCNLCGIPISYVSTSSSMKTHLRWINNITKEYVTFNNTQTLDKSDSEFSETDSDGVENEIEYKLSKKKIARYNNDLVNLIANTSQPISIVDDENFKRMFKNLNKNYKIPCSRILSTELIPNAVI